MDLISQSGRDRQNLARSAKVDAIGQVNLIGNQTLSPIGPPAGRGVGAVVIMKHERAHTIGRTWTKMPNLDAKAEPGRKYRTWTQMPNLDAKAGPDVKRAKDTPTLRGIRSLLNKYLNR